MVTFFDRFRFSAQPKKQAPSPLLPPEAMKQVLSDLQTQLKEFPQEFSTQAQLPVSLFSKVENFTFKLPELLEQEKVSEIVTQSYEVETALKNFLEMLGKFFENCPDALPEALNLGMRELDKLRHQLFYVTEDLQKGPESEYPVAFSS